MSEHQPDSLRPTDYLIKNKHTHVFAAYSFELHGNLNELWPEVEIINQFFRTPVFTAIWEIPSDSGNSQINGFALHGNFFELHGHSFGLWEEKGKQKKTPTMGFGTPVGQRADGEEAGIGRTD